jgi:hypothetical protein
MRGIYWILNLKENYSMNKKHRSGLVKIIALSVMLVGTLAFITCDDNGNKENNSLLLILGLSQAPKLIMYNAGTHTGTLGGRSGADGICNASPNKPAGATNVHAFISLSGDQIIDMPATYGYPLYASIYGPGATLKIANNWASFIGLTITLNMDLYDAGVLPGNTDEFFTGSNRNGTVDLTWTCGDWTSDSGMTDVGYSYVTDSFWIAGAGSSCGSSSYLVCIGEK